MGSGFRKGRAPVVASAIILVFVLFALPAVLCHGGSFREVDEENGR